MMSQPGWWRGGSVQVPAAEATATNTSDPSSATGCKMCRVRPAVSLYSHSMVRRTCAADVDRVVVHHDSVDYVIPLMGTLKPQSNGPLYRWAVTFGTTTRGLGGLRRRPVPSSLYTKCNSPPINGQCSLPTSMCRDNYVCSLGLS